MKTATTQLIVTRTTTEIVVEISLKPLRTTGRKSRQSTLKSAGLFAIDLDLLPWHCQWPYSSGIPAQQQGM